MFCEHTAASTSRSASSNKLRMRLSRLTARFMMSRRDLVRSASPSKPPAVQLCNPRGVLQREPARQISLHQG